MICIVGCFFFLILGCFIAICLTWLYVLVFVGLFDWLLLFGLDCCVV